MLLWGVEEGEEGEEIVHEDFWAGEGPTVSVFLEVELGW